MLLIAIFDMRIMLGRGEEAVYGCVEGESNVEWLLGRELRRGCPGDPSSITIIVSTPAANIGWIYSGGKRGIRILGVPGDVGMATIDRFCYRIEYGEEHGYKVIYEYLNEYFLRLPAGGRSIYNARKIYREDIEKYGIRDIMDRIFRSIEDRINRVTQKLLIIWILTLGASSLGSSEYIYNNYIERLMNKARDMKGRQNVFLVKLMQISRPETREIGAGEEIKERMDVVNRIAYGSPGTLILYRYPYIDNRGIGSIIDILESLAYSDTSRASQLIDVFYSGSLYEIIHKPVKIGSQDYHDMLKKIKDRNDIYAVIVGHETDFETIVSTENRGEITFKQRLFGLNRSYGYTEMFVMRAINRDDVEKMINEVLEK